MTIAKVARPAENTQAVSLAEKAVELDQSPHILDTLAESYFINGRRDAAIDAGKQALSLAKEKRSFSPHLTIGRVKDSKAKKKLRRSTISLISHK